jgi:Fe-S cluster assembly protein SufD
MATSSATATVEPLTLDHVAAMPAPTWHYLHANDTTVEIPNGLTYARDIAVETTGAAQVASEPIADGEGTGAGAATAAGAATTEDTTAGAAKTGAFDAAVADLQQRLDAQRAAAPAVPDLAGKPDTDMVNDTAYSQCQIDIATIEAQHSVAAAYESGLGPEARAWLEQAAGTRTVITVPADAEGTATVRINGVDGAANAAAIDLVVGAGATATLVIALDTPDAGTGVIGSTLRVFAGENSQVDVKTVQTADDTWAALDDEGFVLDAGARVTVGNTALGGSHALVGMAGDLRGKASNANVQTRYLGHGDNDIDFNYILRHRGRNTVCELNANGVLTGTSTKTLRGTIDLLKGCKGAVGHEVETVLIADEGAHNRTVPVILCSEDDVVGNHGATIGHIGPEQQFYLSSRGLSPEQSEAMFVRATLEAAAINAPDDTIADSIERLGTRLLGDFEEVR